MLIDTREPNWVKFAFPNAKVQQLEIGDIASDDMNTIIERKDINDLASSIIDSRYKNQIATLMKYPAFYIVMGTLDDLNYYNKPKTRMVASAISHIPIKYRIPLIQVKYKSDFIEKVKYIMEKRENLEKDLIEIHKVRANPQLRILCSLPGISIKRAKIIKSRYSSVMDAIIHVKEWDRIEGIGMGTVSRCIEALECEGFEII